MVSAMNNVKKMERTVIPIEVTNDKHVAVDEPHHDIVDSSMRLAYCNAVVTRMYYVLNDGIPVKCCPVL
jgi:hypothetical protein